MVGRMLKLSLVSVGLASILIISACGGSSDPSKDYKGLKTAPHDAVSTARSSDSILPDPFKISLVGGDLRDTTIFTEGKPGSLQFKVEAIAGITKYRLDFITQPSGATLTPSPQDPTTWVMNWTPPNGTVPDGNTSTTQPLSIVATVPEDGAVNSYLRAGVHQVGPIPLTVNVKTNGTTVMKVSGLEKIVNVVNEGDELPFTVTLTDKANPNTPPEVYKKGYDNGKNTERAIYDGSPFLREVSLTGDAGVWTRHFIFSAKGLVPQAKPTDNVYHTCFTIVPVSSFGTASQEETHCVDIRYTAQAPEFNFPDVKNGDLSSPLVVTAGASSKIQFSAYTSNKRGTVAVSPIAGLSSLPGKPTVECLNGDNGDSSVQNCTINWDVPCKIKANSKYSLKLRATSKADGLSKNSPVITRAIQINPSSDACGAKPVVAAAPVNGKTPAVAPVAPVALAASATPKVADTDIITPVKKKGAVTPVAKDRHLKGETTGALTPAVAQKQPALILPPATGTAPQFVATQVPAQTPAAPDAAKTDLDKPAFKIAQQEATGASAPTSEAHFVEGASGTLKFTVRPGSGILHYHVTATGLPQGANLAQSKTDRHVWIFTWTPPAGLAESNTTPALKEFTISADETVAGSPAKKGRHAEQKFKVYVHKVNPNRFKPHAKLPMGANQHGSDAGGSK